MAPRYLRDPGVRNLRGTCAIDIDLIRETTLGELCIWAKSMRRKPTSGVFCQKVHFSRKGRRCAAGVNFKQGGVGCLPSFGDAWERWAKACPIRPR